MRVLSTDELSQVSGAGRRGRWGGRSCHHDHHRHFGRHRGWAHAAQAYSGPAADATQPTDAESDTQAAAQVDDSGADAGAEASVDTGADASADA